MIENHAHQEMKSNNPFQIKYNKAVKEISKLVSLNTATKKEVNHFKKLYEEESRQNSTLKQMVSQMQHSYGNGHPSDRSIGSINSCKKYMSSTPIQEADKELQQTGTLSDFPDFRKKLNVCEEKIFNQQELISSLTKQIQNKNQQCFNLREEILLMKKEIQRQLDIKKQCIIIHENDQKVLKEILYKSQEEVHDLKRKLKTYEDSWTNIQAEKSFIPKTAELEYLRDKTNELTFENKKLLRKLKQKKQKYLQDVEQFREENHSLRSKIEKLSGFMNKQQQYIQIYCRGSMPLH